MKQKQRLSKYSIGRATDERSEEIPLPLRIVTKMGVESAALKRTSRHNTPPTKNLSARCLK
jgi:hypothetical protein